MKKTKWGPFYEGEISYFYWRRFSLVDNAVGLINEVNPG